MSNNNFEYHLYLGYLALILINGYFLFKMIFLILYELFKSLSSKVREIKEWLKKKFLNKVQNINLNYDNIKKAKVSMKEFVKFIVENQKKNKTNIN